MAAGEITVYEKFKEKQMSGIADAIAGVGTIDLANDTLKFMLLRVGYVPDAATDEVIADLVPGTNEVSGTGYAAGGIAATITVVNDAGTIRVTASDLIIAQNAGGFTDARTWVLYQEHGTPADANNKLVCWGDFGADKSIVTGSLTVDFENVNSGTLFQY